MYSLILYDTSDFETFPIGGQLTSIKSFLKYLSQSHPQYCAQILLVGVTTNQQEVGCIQHVTIGKVRFDFLPVAYRSRDLSNVKTSMRLEYVKALIKYSKKITSTQKTIHYVHTPEAFLAIKFKNLFAKTVVFSHGSFFDMVDGFRFFSGNPVIKYGFPIFLHILLSTANLIFTLDKKTADRYRRYNRHVVQVKNSVVLPEEVCVKKETHKRVRLLFTGRLSTVKRVDEIIRAAREMQNCSLTIVGDGEEHEKLLKLIAELKLNETVEVVGAVAPEEVMKYLSTHDILVMNSRFEGMPMTIIEALSYGLPIVTTPVGGIEEMLFGYKCAEFTDGTVKSIITAVGKILDGYQNYSEAALKCAKNYDYIQVNEAVFKSIVQRFK